MPSTASKTNSQQSRKPSQKNAADQAELIEGVAKLAKRTSSFMRLVTILLLVSMLFTALLCIRIAYIIRF